MRKFIYLFSILTIQYVNAEILETESFIVEIEETCGEGHVTCNEVTYKGTSKKSGNSITLKGTTKHSTCKDGSPCHFQGYIFKSGNITYMVYSNGELEVTQGEKTLVSEKGHWK